MAFSTSTGLSRYTDIAWPKGLAPKTGPAPRHSSDFVTPLPTIADAIRRKTNNASVKEINRRLGLLTKANVAKSDHLKAVRHHGGKHLEGQRK